MNLKQCLSFTKRQKLKIHKLNLDKLGLRALSRKIFILVSTFFYTQNGNDKCLFNTKIKFIRLFSKTY
ncbi:hypothetical protein DMC01_03150 [Campylobacter troglodytis]|nr:hypothetical protein DMC01_03150 [Campylobacter troglodytis]